MSRSPRACPPPICAICRPAVIFTAEHDPLRQDGERYAERLNSAGVSARVFRHPGAPHGSAVLTRAWEPAYQWQRDAAAVLHDVHHANGRIPAHRQVDPCLAPVPRHGAGLTRGDARTAEDEPGK